VWTKYGGLAVSVVFNRLEVYYFNCSRQRLKYAVKFFIVVALVSLYLRLLFKYFKLGLFENTFTW
jgi:hypothetical protein